MVAVIGARLLSVLREARLDRAVERKVFHA